MNPFAWLDHAWDFSITWSRRHSRLFDHIWTARERYAEALGGRLAAAIAYYGFFAVFALALVAYAIVGFVLANNTAAVDAVNTFLKQNIPFLDATQIAAARNTVAIAGLIGLVFTGVAWIESMRSSQRAIWGLRQQPGNLFVRRALDLAIMLGIGLLLALSLYVQAGINDAIKPLLLQLAPENVTVGVQDTINAIARGVGIFLSFLVNIVLAASLLTGVSRLRMSLARLVPSTLVVAVGLSILSTLGRLYIDWTSRRPAYQIVGGTVALLLFLYLFNQLLLYGAALAATSRWGTVRDLADGSGDVGETGDQDNDHDSGSDSESSNGRESGDDGAESGRDGSRAAGPTAPSEGAEVNHAARDRDDDGGDEAAADRTAEPGRARTGRDGDEDRASQ
jgi:membrane protein